MLNPLFYILGEHAFLAKMQWLIGISFVLLIIISVPFYGVKGCLLAFGICKIIYVGLMIIRLRLKYKLSVFPI